jgi:enoyl-CoA hydratase/carnithine racemase
MPTSDLLYSVKDNVARIVINREQKRNSITAELQSLFLTHLDLAEKDDSVRAFCISGAGDKTFCSGADLSGSGQDGSNAVKKFADLLKRIAGYSKPTVARVNGSCMAGGIGLMLACDIVVAVDDATFGTPEVNIGLFPMIIGALLFKNIQRKKAMEMALLGNRLTAQEALEAGMLTRTVPKDALDGEVERILKILVSNSPIGMKIGKQAFYAIEDMPFEQAIDFLSDKLLEVASTEDAIEGITAFLQKRTPNFKGK